VLHTSCLCSLGGLESDVRRPIYVLIQGSAGIGKDSIVKTIFRLKE